MGRKLTCNVFLPNPAGDLSPLVAFLAGEELPEWAEDLVGPHVFEKAPKAEKSTKERIPSGLKEEPKAPPEFKVPSAKAAIATWKKFAKDAYGIQNLPENITRDEVIAEVYKVDPQLVVEEA